MEDSSVTGRAYLLLRGELIACRLQPGARLNISRLQGMLGLSQAAVREALSRLTSEGLVEIERHRGFRAAPVSMSGFRELTQACMTVEIPCLESSIRNGDRNWERTLVASYETAARTLRQVVAGKQGIEAYSNQRLAFYEALLGACDNGWLLWSWRLLYAQNTRYRHVYMPLARFELDLRDQHANFMRAALARDVAQAVALGAQNYESVIRFIEERLAQPAAAAPVTGRRTAGRAAASSGGHA